MFVESSVMRRCTKRLPGSDGPTIDTTSGSVDSSVAKVLLNCSSSDFLGSTFVGDRQASRATAFESLEKLNDCFFFEALGGALLEVRKIVFLLSFDD